MLVVALEESEHGWFCSECGRQHQGLITCFGPDEPHGWHRTTPLARLRGRLARSFCEVTVEDRSRCYVRGHLSIPVNDGDGSAFLWSVWVEIEQADFDSMVRSLNDPERVGRPPVQGLLDTPLPYDPPTQGLRVQVQEQRLDEVPQITVTGSPTHPLQLEQEGGISVHRVAAINAELLGPPQRS